MQKTLTRIFCLALSALLGLSLLAGVLPTSAKAATSYDLATLLTNGEIKPLGRTKVSQTGNGITADWSANGFEINVSGGTTITVGYESSRTNYVAVHVDDAQINADGTWAGSDVDAVKAANIPCSQGTGSFTVTLPEGEGVRKVSVFRENGLTMNGADYFRFTTLETDATIAGRPDDKELFIEVIGDSIGTGSGSIGKYQAGIEWLDADHSAQSSFGWLLSKELGADLSIVARGGSGLLTPAEKAQFNDDGSNAGENIDTQVNSSMLNIYPYASGHHQEEGPYTYDPATDRKPDLVVLELGANDSLDYDKPAKTALWKTRLEDMIQLVRNTYQDPNLKILLEYQSAIPYAQMLDVADGDPNIYSCHYYFHGNGSIAKETQLSGHPDASDHELIAEALLNCIKEQDILGLHGEVVVEPDYEDVPYYVSANGDDTNDGKSIDNAKQSFTAAVAQAVADKDSLTDNSRVVIYLDSANGEIPNYTSGNKQHLGGDETVTSSSGQKLPVLVTTLNYTDGTDGVAKAVLDTSHKANGNSHGSMVVYNDFTFRSITIQGTTRPYTDEATKFYRDRNLYSGYNEVVFDDVTFSHNDNGLTCSNSGGWRVSAGLFGSFELPTTETVSSVTFLNGDYTGLNYVTGVNASAIGGETTSTNAIHKVIIGDGAAMGNVIGLYSTFGPKSVTVELRGGTVKNYYGTKSGTADEPATYNTNLTTIFNGGSIKNAKYFGTGDYITFIGDVTNEFRKGQFSGQVFAGLGSYVTLKGNLTNNISGGEIRVEPQASGDGIFLAGHTTVTINGNATNNISSGDLNLLFKTAGVDSGIYLGQRTGDINGNLTNNIYGGNLFAASYVAGLENEGDISAYICMTMSSGNITGTLANNITAGTFDGSAANCSKIIFGTQSTNKTIGKIVSVIGEKDDPNHGPRFEGTVYFGSDRNRVGQNLGNITPNANNCSSDVVIKTTIYSGVFSQVFAAPYRAASGTAYHYVIGGVETNIYGGRFAGRFFGTGSAPVCGHVTTNIYGGYFTGIYGTYGGTVYDGVEINIYDFTEFLCDNSSDSVKNQSKIYPGGATTSNDLAPQISAVTAGRDPIKLTLNLPATKELLTPVYAGFSDGGTASKVKVELQNGILPNIYSSAENETFAGSVELVVSGGTVKKLVPVNAGATISGGVTCTISGGTVNSYVGTASGTADAAVTCTTNLTTIVSGGNVKSYMGTGDYVNFEGLIHNNICGGQVSGAQFAGLGNNVTLEGNLTNSVSSGRILVNPTTSNSHGIYLSGRDYCTINGDVTNNISGGTVGITFKVNDVASAIYFGGRSNTNINGNLTNNVSGGTIGSNTSTGITPKSVGFYAGSQTSGGITGTLTNNFSGGKFTFSTTGTFYFAGQATSTYAGKIVNVLGDKKTGNGPSFSGNLYLSGNSGKFGVSSKSATTPTEISSDIVVSNTIYGGTYGDTVICSLQSKDGGFTKGSVQTDIYGGTFTNLRGTGAAPIYGKACTNIHGGTFSKGIYGVYGGVVKDGVELNIFGLDGDCNANVRLAYNATIGSELTTGHAATLTISHDGTFNGNVTATYSSSGTINGSIHVEVSAGTYTKGFNMGVPVKKALAAGYSLLDTETGDVITLPDDTTTSSGTTSVTVGRLTTADLKLKTAAVVLYNDLGVDFKRPNDCLDNYDDLYAVFQLGDRETKVEEYSVVDGKVVFKFRNIAPHQIGETIYATLYATNKEDGMLYKSETTQYSIKQYCNNMLAKSSSEELRTLLVDLLNYGAWSQKYVNNSLTDEQLVNFDLPEEQKALRSVTLEDKQVVTTLDGATVPLKSVTLHLQKSVDILLKFEAASTENLSVKFTVDGKTYEITEFTKDSGDNNYYYAYFTHLNAGQMRQLVNATVYQNDQAVSSTLTYSVETYAAKHQNDEAPLYLADLVKAMMLYGDSAEAYVDANVD